MRNLFKDINQIGQRLRLARQGACLSTRQVQDLLNIHNISISHATIGNYERGITKPSEDILVIFAKIYGRDLEWIRGTGLTLEPICYRALRSVSVSEKNHFKSQAESWLNLYLYVENLLNYTLKRNAQTGFVVKSGESGQELAERMRRELKFEDHPISSTIRILEDFGIYTIQVPSEARIDAFVGSFDDSRAVVLNSTLSNDRIRLNAMHELAHFLYDDGPFLSPDDVETRAFEFASHMLLPESQLCKAFQLKSMVRLVDYKERFGISLAAMIFRARKSKIISKQLYQRIWASFSQFGYRRMNPAEYRVIDPFVWKL